MTTDAALQLSRLIDQSSRPLAKWTLDEHLRRDPQLAGRSGENWRSQWEGAIVTRLGYLAQAIALDEPGVFAESILWLGDAFRAREVDDNDLRISLQCLREVMIEQLPGPMGQCAAEFCHLAAKDLEGENRSPDSAILAQMDTAALRYLEALLTGDQAAAIAVCVQALERECPIDDILVRIIQPAQAELGRLWHMDEISIADEHAATAITESVLVLLHDRIEPAPLNGRTVVATTVAGEQHAIGLRMVAIVFELAGWRCQYIGAGIPHPSVVETVIRHDADLLALSCTSTLHLRSVVEVVRTTRAQASEKLNILIGGRPFVAFPGLWKKVGADAVARDAPEGLRIATALTDRDATNSD
ncbi:MAG: hypothetical protein HND57_08915 [Planctomycetes bacterium]|nr:hypothetical protein [Planctomycetota bacterium]